MNNRKAAFIIIIFALCTKIYAQILPVKIDIMKLVIPNSKYLTNSQQEKIFEFPTGFLIGKKKFEIKDLYFESLNNAFAESRFIQIDASGNATALFGKAKATTKKVQVYIDYGRYKVSIIENGEEKKYGYLLRLEAEITNFDIDADISSLFAIGFAAKGGKIQGKIKISCIGLSGSGLDKYITTVKSISEDSLLEAIEKFAILRSKIDSDEITINPDVLPDGINT